MKKKKFIIFLVFISITVIAATIYKLAFSPQNNYKTENRPSNLPVVPADIIQGFKILEKIVYDWQNNGSKFTFFIESYAQPLEHADYNAARLRIRTPGGNEYYYSFENGIAEIEHDYINTPNTYLFYDNLINSYYIYISPKLKNDDDRPSLVILGKPFERLLGQVIILTIKKSGVPKEIFNVKNFGLEDLQKSESNTVLIIGKTKYDSGSHYWEDYNPFWVYSFNESNPAKYSEAKSKEYNVEKYSGWSDPKDKRRFVVYFSITGKKLLLPLKDALILEEKERGKDVEGDEI